MQFIGISNARQLGGYKTIDGKTIVENRLFRTGKLDNATESDKDFLINECNLKTVVDLRAPLEAEMRPEVSWENVEFVNFYPFTQEIAVKVKKRSKNKAELFLGFIEEGYLYDDMYADVVTSDVSRLCYMQFFDKLLSMKDDEAILWHCSAGKDRTGITSLLVMEVLGVPKNDCIENFMLSDKILMPEINEILSLVKNYTDDPKVISGCRILAGVDKFYIDRLYEKAEKYYGSVKNLVIQRFGVTERDIEILKKRYLK